MLLVFIFVGFADLISIILCMHYYYANKVCKTCVSLAGFLASFFHSCDRGLKYNG